jgi:hypothetical protein
VVFTLAILFEMVDMASALEVRAETPISRDELIPMVYVLLVLVREGASRSDIPRSD